jgi:hypothetical protein
MAKKPESRLQLRIQHGLRKAFPGCYVRKIHGNEFMSNGMADLLCCINGLFFAFEVKMPTKELERLQDNERREVLDAGGVAARVESVAQAIKIVKAALKRDGRVLGR